MTNAAEAMNFEGTVNIRLSVDDDKIKIQILDSGPAISSQNIKRIFEKGFSTKSHGNGLGLYNAKREIDKVNGSISFTQTELTCVEITLPTTEAPKYFSEKINLQGVSKFIILDDDENIHQVWKKRFKRIPVSLEHYYRAEDLLKTYRQLPSSSIFLSDYELFGEKLSGLDCIKRVGAQSQSILVTARPDEQETIKECLSQGVKILPKSLANEIEISYQRESKKAVLIDDDKLTHLSWKIAAKKSRSGSRQEITPKIIRLEDNSTLKIYPKVGHIPMEEIPEESLLDVMNFLENI
jgi:hypothetical protein